MTISKNILNMYTRALDTAVYQNGLDWYNEANTLANTLATEYKQDITKVAHVISTLSPACTWEINKRNATAMIKNYYIRGLAGAKGTVVSTYGQNKKKAIRILQGEELITPKSLKTWNFANNILKPTSSEYVTIDRHALRIFEGLSKRGSKSMTPKRYLHVADAYIKTAKHLKMSPCQLQAITWEQHRIELGIK